MLIIRSCCPYKYTFFFFQILLLLLHEGGPRGLLSWTHAQTGWAIIGPRRQLLSQLLKRQRQPPWV